LRARGLANHSELEQESCVKFATYNIQYGRGRDGRFDLARIAAELRGADVIALQEVERWWQRSGMQDQPAELARLLGFDRLEEPLEVALFVERANDDADQHAPAL
jgi:endonuclease/exonuclease/phosphatase family metal-dependent hydrolase